MKSETFTLWSSRTKNSKSWKKLLLMWDILSLHKPHPLPPLTYWLTCFLCYLIGWGDFLIWNLTFTIYLFLHQKTPNNHGALFFYIIHLASHNLILYLLYIDQNIANMDHLDYHHNCLRLLDQALKFLIVNH